MTLHNQTDIAISAEFPPETVLLSEQDSVEAYIVITNRSPQNITIDFTSGQTYEIYLFDEKDQLVSLWSSGMMFTQALHSIDIKAGEVGRFGGHLELKDLDGKSLTAGTYTIEVELKSKISERNDPATTKVSQKTGVNLVG